jgi:hypothetical protein
MWSRRETQAEVTNAGEPKAVRRCMDALAKSAFRGKQFRMLRMAKATTAESSLNDAR